MSQPKLPLDVKALLLAGVEQAVHRLMSNEEEADACLLSGRASEPVQAQQQQRPPPVPTHTPTPVLTSSGAGVAGILRREAQLASQNDEYVITTCAISTAQMLNGSLNWQLFSA